MDERADGESLEQWAARLAPTLDNNAWRNLDRWDATGRHILSAHIARWGNEQARALLAYRDEMVLDFAPEPGGPVQDFPHGLELLEGAIGPPNGREPVYKHHVVVGSTAEFLGTEPGEVLP